MKNFCLNAAVCCLLAGVATAQPVIRTDGTGIVNAASYAAMGLPNSPVAQGSIFTIFGSGLGPAEAAQASSFPLSTSLQGVSISIAQGQSTVFALPLYVSASQINAIMPSNAPLGADTVTVNFNGQSSTCAGCQGALAQVVNASPGIFAINKAGSGQGIITSADNRLITYTQSSTAGELLNIWATGLGAIQGSDAEPPVAGDIGRSPTVYVGGVEVQATYYGRSPCCSGLDQIQFQAPSNVTGCNVPVAVQIGSVVSNFVSVAIASTPGSCSGFNGISIPNLESLDAQGAITTGDLELSRLVFSQVQTLTYQFPPDNVRTATGTTDYAYANFESYPFSMVSLTEFPLQILNTGACSVYTFNPGQASDGPPFQTATPTVNSLRGVGLDAGGIIMINGPHGGKQIAPVPPPFPASVGNYGAVLGADQGDPNPLYFMPGSSYTMTSEGGKNVRPFTAALEMPQPLTWTNQSSIAKITRANGVTVTWSGADPNGSVIISGMSLGANGGAAGFNCTAAPSAGQFEVPPIVLQALPPSAVNNSDGIDTDEARLQIGIATKPLVFTAAGLGIAQATASFSIAQSFPYQ